MNTKASDEFLARQKVLVLSPHADDEAFGCAGTLAKVKKLGGEAYVMAFTVGDLDQYNGEDGVVRGDVREEEFERTAEFLDLDGWDIVFRDSEKHLRLDQMPRRDLIGIIERESEISLDNLQPTMVMLPAHSYNQDHVAVFEAGFTACRPGTPGVKAFPSTVLAYDNPTLFWNVDRDKFHANFYVDISEFLDVKIQALKMHESQQRPSPHHCSAENLERLVRLRGSEISAEAAEAFCCLRFVI
ncbi:MAG: PIG-L family deacetylase [Planctomycetes bacterium]|nr:PIG-L family deacetylase [Planctomycetota bacterium]